MKDEIQATVAILTCNSAKTLPRALESVKDFTEIIVCDGGSTDDTLAVAQAYGARVIPQDKQFLADDGRIQNFAGVRNQTLVAASYNWFFFLDSDEYIDEKLAQEIQEKTAWEPAAFWVPRKYVYRGEIIDRSVAYPSQQMRLFHRATAVKFIKEVHEKIELRPGIVPVLLTRSMYVPLPDTVKEMKAKWRNYLVIERTRRMPLGVWQWIRLVLREEGIAMLYLLRLLRILLFCRGTRLPVAYELARVWYQWALIRDSFFAIRIRYVTND